MGKPQNGSLPLEAPGPYGTVFTGNPFEANSPGYPARYTTTLGGNRDLAWTVSVYGHAGNRVSITYVDPGAPNQPLTVAVIGHAVTISLATNAAGAITTTAAQLRDRWGVGTPPANTELAAPTFPTGSDGSGILVPAGPFQLSGGMEGLNVQGGCWLNGVFVTTAGSIIVMRVDQLSTANPGPGLVWVDANAGNVLKMGT